MTKIKLLFFLGLTSAFIFDAHAGSATWNGNPSSGDWNSALNWTPTSVPNGPADTATFSSSTLTDVSISADTEVDSIVFNAGAAAYTLSSGHQSSLTISGAGVTNNSGIVQNFVAVPVTTFDPPDWILFNNGATAGSLTSFTTKGADEMNGTPGETIFDDSSTAGNATFITEGVANGVSYGGGYVTFEDNASAANGTFITDGGTTPESGGGEVHFIRSSRADSATFVNNPGTVFHAFGGYVEMAEDSSADNATFINNGATVEGGQGGMTVISSHTANCTLIANGGTNGGRGGQIWIGTITLGESPRVEVFGNGAFYCGQPQAVDPKIAIGSLEGDGDVFMQFVPLIIGSNDLSTVFSGSIRDFSWLGKAPLKKIGKGTLRFTGGNHYAGGTVIEQGTLEVSNRRGSGTGKGPVNVRGGTLAGQGTIGGKVTVGTEDGSRAFLSPGRIAASPQTLTIESSLTFNPGASYDCDFNSSTTTADQVAAQGVTINPAALFAAQDSSNTSLPSGTTVIVLNNTAATPIAGAFSNLADGATFTVGSNTFQANYEGGDGNDLTLTVVP